MTRTSLLAAGLAALLSGGCPQGPSQSAQPIGRRIPTLRAEYTIWQKPLVDAVAERNCAVPLVVGQPVARRFRTPASGASLQGALYVIGTEDPEGRSWRMADVSIAVCRNVAVYLGKMVESGTGETIVEDATEQAVVTIRVPPKGRIGRVAFALDYDLAGGTDYWLVVQQILFLPAFSDATQPLPLWMRGRPSSAREQGAVALPWGERILTPDPIYLVQAGDKADAVVWAASDPTDVRPVVLSAPAFAAELKLLRHKIRQRPSH